MMVLPNVELIRPATIEEAILEAAADPAGSLILGGGTDLLLAIKLGLAAPARLIDITAIPSLTDVRLDAAGPDGAGPDWAAPDWASPGGTGEDEAGPDKAGDLVVGAGVRLSDLLQWKRLRPRYAALWEAALSVGSPQLRNSGTVGGNVCLNTRCTFYNQTPLWRARRGPCLKTGGQQCHAVARSPRCRAVLSADTPPALAVLRAEAGIARMEEGRVVEARLPIAALYGGDGRERGLSGGQILTGLHVPAPPRGYRSGYAKYRSRRSIDFPLAGVAAGLRIEEGVIRDARLVLGAVAPNLVEVEETAGILEGREPNGELFAAAAAAAAAAAEPVSNLAGSAEQRKHMVGVMARRLLTRLAVAP